MSEKMCSTPGHEEKLEHGTTGLCQACYRRKKREDRGLQKPGPKPDPSKPYSRHGGEKTHHKRPGAPDRLTLVLGGYCGNGHLLTEENTYRYPEDAKYTPGKLVCKQCRIKSSRKAQGYSGDLGDPIQPWRGNPFKVTCANDHEYTEETTYIDPTTGWKSCKICMKVNDFTARAKRYGLSPEQLQQMIDESRDLCAICGKQDDSLHVDHDHATGAVRALLCSNCNRGLGYFQDNPELLRAGAKYLEFHRGKGTLDS